MNIYLATIIEHGRSAKTKGIIGGSLAQPRHYADKLHHYAINASSDQQAYDKLCSAFIPADKRPLSGRSYIRKLRVGHTLYVKPGYPIGYNDDGSVNRAHTGKVSELYTDNAISLDMGNGHTYVDFGLSELAQRLM